MTTLNGSELCAQFDFFAFFDLVVGSSANTAEKLIALIHARQIARRNCESFLSRANVQVQASVADNTLQRALPVVRTFFTAEPRAGRATVYRPNPEITADSVEAAIQAMRVSPKKAHTPKRTIPHDGVETIPQNGAYPSPKMGHHKDILKDRLKETTTLAREPFERTRENLDRLQNELLAACNGAADPAGAPGLLALGEPIRWIENGCDLELDILPTIRQRSHKARPRSIRSWTYFTQAVAEAKADRERPMPAAEPAPARAGWQPRPAPEPAWKRQYEVAL